jgi:hypothetical protein
VTESVTIAAEPAAEATEQENDENDNEDGSQRHDLSAVSALLRKYKTASEFQPKFSQRAFD